MQLAVLSPCPSVWLIRWGRRWPYVVEVGVRSTGRPAAATSGGRDRGNASQLAPPVVRECDPTTYVVLAGRRLSQLRVGLRRGAGKMLRTLRAAAGWDVNLSWWRSGQELGMWRGFGSGSACWGLWGCGVVPYVKGQGERTP